MLPQDLVLKVLSGLARVNDKLNAENAVVSRGVGLLELLESGLFIVSTLLCHCVDGWSAAVLPGTTYNSLHHDAHPLHHHLDVMLSLLELHKQSTVHRVVSTLSRSFSSNLFYVLADPKSSDQAHKAILPA